MNAFDETPHTDDFFVSTDKAKLNTFFVISELKKTYWGEWMQPMDVMRAIDNSLCFGLYQRLPEGKEQQVGFARVVTDYATFAWICDVFIAEAYRRRGLSKFLMSVIVGHPEVAPRNCLLNTRDAHELYARFGFQVIQAMKRQGSSV